MPFQTTLLVTPDAATVAVVRRWLDAPVRHVDSLEEAHGVLDDEDDIAAVLLDVALPPGVRIESVVPQALLDYACPVILLVDREDDDAAEQAVALGVQDVLVRADLNRSWLRSAIRYAVERRQALAALRRNTDRLSTSERRFRTMVQQMADGILIVNEEGTIQFVNRAAQELFGRPARALEGAFWGYGVVVKEAAELDIARPDGTQRVVEMRTVSVDWEGERAFLTTLHDVTERKRARLALEALTEELQQSNDELRLFADMAGHDLREPLRSTSLYLELLLERHGEGIAPEVERLVDLALAGARRLRRLIDDLLAYARVDVREVAPVDTQALLRETVEDMMALLKEADAQVVCEDLPTVQADRGQLQLVFQNLISNAVKFRGDAPPRIEVMAERAGWNWQFAVADNGIGLDPAYAQHIFGAFERLHDRATYDGTGMGLSICQKVVRRHGGTIWVESAPGEGATFYFTLPMQPQTPPVLATEEGRGAEAREAEAQEAGAHEDAAR